MISADNLRRKFFIFLCEPGPAWLTEKNKKFSEVPVPTRKFLINKEKAYFEKSEIQLCGGSETFSKCKKKCKQMSMKQYMSP